MNLNYNNPQFRILDKIVMKGEKGMKELYYSSNTNLPGLEDFIEYGFKYWVNKYKYGSWSPLNYLNPSLKKELGCRFEDLSRVEKTMFPTVLEIKEQGGPEYYGILTANKQKLIIFEIPPGYEEIELFDTSSSDPESPKITISNDETHLYHLVCLTITNEDIEGVKSEVSVSLLAWSNSINANRNTNTYLLRNDEIPVHPLTVTKLENTSVWVDNASSTILGTKEMKPTLIGKKIEKYRDNNEWDPDVSYTLGDKVEKSGLVWISAHNKNKGNDPSFSSSWIKEELLGEDYQSRRIFVHINGEGAVCDPESFIASNDSSNVELIITYFYGYVPTLITYGRTASILNFVSDIYSSYKRHLETGEDMTIRHIIGGDKIPSISSVNITVIKPEIDLTYSIADGGTNKFNSLYIGEKFTKTIDFGSSVNLASVVGVNKSYNILGAAPDIVPLENVEIDNENGIVTFSDVVDLYCDSINYNLLTKANVYTIEVTEHIGYIVDHRTQTFNIISNEGATVRFYPANTGTTEGLSFGAIITTDEGARGEISLSATSNEGSTVIGGSNIKITRMPTYFELAFDEVTFNCTIKTT